MNSQLDYLCRLLITAVPLAAIAWFVTGPLQVSGAITQFFTVFVLIAVWDILVDERFLEDWRNAPMQKG